MGIWHSQSTVSGGTGTGDLVLGETSSTAYRGDRGKAAYDHAATTHNKAFVGLENVDNTSDVSKPISTLVQTALDLKQATLVSGTNIKTINNTSLLGSGNITITGEGSSETTETIKSKLGVADTNSDGYLIYQDWNAFNNKQTALVSGTNIKTVNSTSLLGSGDIAITNDHSTSTNRDSAGNHTKILPLVDSTNIFSIYKADGTTSLMTFDSTNEIIKIMTNNSERLIIDSNGLTTYGDFNIIDNNAQTVASFPLDITTNNIVLGDIDDVGNSTTLTIDDDNTQIKISGSLNIQDNIIKTASFKDCGYTFLDKGNSGTDTQTFDYTAGSHQKITATGNFTIALSNFPPTGNLGEMLIELVNGGSAVVTFPSILWIKPDGTTTTSISTYLAANTGRTALQTSGVDFILLWSRDASTYYGRLV